MPQAGVTDMILLLPQAVTTAHPSPFLPHRDRTRIARAGARADRTAQSHQAAPAEFTQPMRSHFRLNVNRHRRALSRPPARRRLAQVMAEGANQGWGSAKLLPGR